MKYVYSITDLYEFENTIAKGSFGNVKVGVCSKTMQRYAIKTIRKYHLLSSDMNGYFFNELTVLQRCEHQNLMRVHELIEDDDSFYIVSELLEGGDLDK